LILLQNKMPEVDGKISELTEEWHKEMKMVASKEYDVLKDHFADIYIGNIPFLRMDDNSEFEDHIQDLKNKLKEIAAERELIKKKLWLQLYPVILTKVSDEKPINLKLCYSELLHAGQTSIDIVMQAFLRMLQQTDLRTEYFQAYRKFAVEMLARNLAQELVHGHKEDLLLYEDWVNDYGEQRLKTLWQMMSKYEPCTAIYEDSKQKIHCYQMHVVHDTIYHKSREPTSLLLDLIPHHFRWKAIEIPAFKSDESPEAFNSVSVTFHMKLHEHLSKYKASPEGYVYESYAQIWKAFGWEFRKSNNYPGSCHCCMKSLPRKLRKAFMAKLELVNAFVDKDCFARMDTLHR